MDLRFFRLLVSRRVFAVINKDSIRLFRDRSMILLMLSQPILIMLVAGFGFTSDIRHLGAVVVQEDDSIIAEKIVESIITTEYFDASKFVGSEEEAEEIIRKGDARVAIIIPEDFSENLESGKQAEIKVIVDGSDKFISSMVQILMDKVTKGIEDETTRYVVLNVWRGIDQLEKGSEELTIGLSGVYTGTKETDEYLKMTSTGIGQFEEGIGEVKQGVLFLHSLQTRFEKGSEKLEDALEQDRELKYRVKQALIMISDGNEKMSGGLFRVRYGIRGVSQAIQQFSNYSNLNATQRQELRGIEMALTGISKGIGTLREGSTTVSEKSMQLGYGMSVGEQGSVELMEGSDKLVETYSVNKDVLEELIDGLDMMEMQAALFKSNFDKLVAHHGMLVKGSQQLYTGSREIHSGLQSMNQYNPLNLVKPVTTEYDVLYQGENLRFIDLIAPAIIALTIAFSALLTTAPSIAKEREMGTLERVSTTPVYMADIILGKVITYLSISLLQGLILFLIAVAVFSIRVGGSLILLALVFTLVALIHLGLGTMISAIVRTENQAIQTIPIILLPALLFSGMFWPLDAMPSYMQDISGVIPLTHAVQALRLVMIKGAGLNAIIPQLSAMVVFFIIFFMLGVLMFIKEGNNQK
ncbi:MAG: ABC transporter permease [Methanophagales archaeon]|nr:ABC transporter permease [Methanophagales archaeon]